MTSDLQRTIGEWGEATFPDSTPATIMMHLREEVDELARAIALDNPSYTSRDANVQAVAEEAADVYLILLHIAHRIGFDLEQSAQAKHVVNLGRQWHDDGRGYAKHVETQP